MTIILLLLLLIPNMALPKLPKKHKAVIYDEPGTLSTKIEFRDTPDPGHGEVLINL